jgi:hypothetical protein
MRTVKKNRKCMRLLLGNGYDISKIPTDLDSSGQNQFFLSKKSRKKHDALLKIYQNLHC